MVTPSAISASRRGSDCATSSSSLARARRLDRGDDAAAGARDLLVARAGQPHLELVGAVAAIDQVGVAVDQARRDPAAVAVDRSAPASKAVGNSLSGPAKAMRPSRAATTPFSTMPRVLAARPHSLPSGHFARPSLHPFPFFGRKPSSFLPSYVYTYSRRLAIAIPLRQTLDGWQAFADMLILRRRWGGAVSALGQFTSSPPNAARPAECRKQLPPVSGGLKMTFAYVIVGGGSAGSTLAARLSENPSISVCMLEAGGDGKDLLIRAPVGVAALLPGQPKSTNGPSRLFPNRG